MRCGASARILVWVLAGASCLTRSAGAITVNVLPLPDPNSRPQGIAAGPDGSIWFTEYGANRIGRITSAGVITEFPIPTADSQPWGIAAGADGNVWFTETTARNIGRITPTGVVTEFPAPPGLLTLREIDRAKPRHRGGVGERPYARTVRRKIGEGALRKQVASDGHAPEAYRADTVRNLDAWYDAFEVRPGQRLYLAPTARVRVW